MNFFSSILVQRVLIGGVGCSSPKAVPSGVPQGSVYLGLRIINGLLKVFFKNMIYAVADDTKLYGSPAPDLKNDLNNAAKRCGENHVQDFFNAQPSLNFLPTPKSGRKNTCVGTRTKGSSRK